MNTFEGRHEVVVALDVRIVRVVVVNRDAIFESTAGDVLAGSRD